MYEQLAVDLSWWFQHYCSSLFIHQDMNSLFQHTWTSLPTTLPTCQQHWPAQPCSSLSTGKNKALCIFTYSMYIADDLIPIFESHQSFLHHCSLIWLVNFPTFSASKTFCILIFLLTFHSDERSKLKTSAISL